MRESCRIMARRSSDSPAPSKRSTARPAGPDFSREAALLGSGARCVAGIDEAGRGPLAGPVVAAAVILDPNRLPQGLDDSKKLDRAERERLFDEIVTTSWVGIASASAREIDILNIRGATLLAMRRALHALGDPPCHVLIDGRDVPPRLRCPGTAVIAGDALSLSIAAASIVAKVTRDRMMQRACPSYDGYGFSRHVGYATAEHLAAIARLGPTPLHRMSFRPLRVDLLDAAE
jgi:ribonuclease HII